MKNEELTKTLTEAITGIINDVLTPGKDFILGQAPSVVKELISFKKINNFYMFIVILTLSVSTYICSNKFSSIFNSDIPLLFNLLHFVWAIWFFCCIEELIKLFTAPKIFIIEYAVKLSKVDSE